MYVCLIAEHGARAAAEPAVGRLRSAPDEQRAVEVASVGWVLASSPTAGGCSLPLHHPHPIGLWLYYAQPCVQLPAPAPACPPPSLRSTHPTSPHCPCLDLPRFVKPTAALPAGSTELHCWMADTVTTCNLLALLLPLHQAATTTRPTLPSTPRSSSPATTTQTRSGCMNSSCATSWREFASFPGMRMEIEMGSRKGGLVSAAG